MKLFFARLSAANRNLVVGIVTFCVVLICLTWLGVYYKIQDEQQRSIKNAGTVTTNLARAFEEHTLRTIKHADQLLRFLKYQYETGGAANVLSYINNDGFESRLFILLSIFDEYGDLQVSSQQPFELFNIKDRQYFHVHQSSVTRYLYISNPVLDRTSGKWSIQHTRRIDKSDGNFGGVVVASIDPFYFTDFYKQIDLGPNPAIALIGRDGIIQAWESNNTSLQGQDLGQLDRQLADQLIGEAGQFTMESAIDNTRRIYSYRALRNYPFVVLIGMSEEAALSPFFELRRYYLWGGLILTLFIASVCGALTSMVVSRQRAEQLQNALYRILETANKASNLDGLYSSVHAIIGEFIPAGNFTIALYDQVQETISFPYRVDERDGNPGSRRVAKGLTEYVVKTGRPLRLNPQLRAELEARGEIQSVGTPSLYWMGVPLKTANNKIFGVMSVQSYSNQIPYTEKDENVFIFVSNQVAMAIERKQAEETSRYLGLHDSLTGLYNRAYFTEELNRLDDLRHCPVAIFMCDINGLKLVNDTFGHTAGDQMLTAAARLIRNSIRNGDAAARMGGDEIAIILPRADESVARSLSERLQKQIAGYNEEHSGLPLSLSLGYAIRHRLDTPLPDLLKQADENMYREKLHHARNTRRAIVQMVMKLLEERNLISKDYSRRLHTMVDKFARQLGFAEPAITNLQLLAKFHDIGKIGVSDQLFLKPGSLTAAEKKEIERHCEIGFRISLLSAELAPIADWILKHHEWWNGAGYPLGLKGEEIPRECLIFAVVDAYAVMTSDCCYRQALDRQSAIAELMRGAGTQFEPILVEKFVASI